MNRRGGLDITAAFSDVGSDEFTRTADLTLPPLSAMLDPMSYPGGKNGAGVYQRIINLMPPHDVYIEPFVGGGAVMRLKRPARVNIALDLSQDALRDLASAFPAVGSTDLVASSQPGRQACTGGNGTVATNGGGRRRTSPVAELSDRTSPPPAISADAITVGEASSFEFLNRDGIAFLARYPFQGAELVYCDPPYLMHTRSGRKLYGDHEMTDRQHLCLLRVLQDLPCRVMISGYKSDMYAGALKDWHSIHFETMTRGGRMATEWLWFNFPPPVALHDYRYLGEGYRERERIKRKKSRWTKRLARMPMLERQALLSAMSTIDCFNGASANTTPPG